MVTASFKMSTGAGGASISPGLRIDIPVHEPDRIYEFIRTDLLAAKDSSTALLMLQDQFSSRKLHNSCVMLEGCRAESLIDVCTSISQPVLNVWSPYNVLIIAR